VIVSEHGGQVPSEQRDLRSLPGVGSYTASAVASIAFGAPVVAMDTNVRRIVARVAGGAEPDEVAEAWMANAASGMLNGLDPGGWNEAVMDLGREHCRPIPRCGGCPLRPWCRFANLGRVGRSSSSRQASFEGSNRQARGRVVAVLRQRTAAATLPQLVRLGGINPDRVAAAVEGLVRDGVVERTPSGRIRLPA
jgi:A/G-specific adenine glycosylase